MEYSLYSLNQSCNLKNLTLTNLIDKLNLIGFEVDEIFIEKVKTNSNLENIRIQIKIPSNREDLLNENFLKRELSTIFLFDLKNTWNKFKNNYSFLLKQKYHQSYHYISIPLQSSLSNILIYNIQVNQCEYPGTPNWIKNKLTDAGLSSSSTIDDLLTLINFEWGQNINLLLSSLKESQYPTNNLFFDNYLLEQLSEPTFYGTKENCLLEKGTIVLKDTNGEILSALGIFNSFSSIGNNNDKLIFQGCFYDIHENVLKLNTINTKISLRFLRKTYLETFKFAFQRLLTLVEILTSSKIELKKYKTVETSLELKSTKLLCLKTGILKKLLNIKKIDLEVFQKANLKLLCKTKNELYFEIPTFRKDLTREIDLIEEYSRFIGYKNFPEILPKKQLTYYLKNKTSIQFVKQFFLNYGFNEIITSSIEELTKGKSFSVQINNPLNNDLVCLRPSLLGKIIETFENNLKLGAIRNNYFEIGRVFKISNQKFLEQDKLSGIFQLSTTEKGINSSLEWFKAKGFIEAFLANFGYEQLEIELFSDQNSYYHPTKSIVIKTKSKILARFGELNPLKTNLPGTKGAIYIFEVNINYLQNWKMASKIITYQEYSKYPVITKDISFAISRKKDFSKIKEMIQQNCKELKTVQFFDIYFEEGNKDSVKVALRLEFQSKLQTLLTENIEKEIKSLKEMLITKFEVHFVT
jgi:phenylalanyl-tRNA synthetase beta chain